MPTYTFKNTQTQEVFSKDMKMSERQEFLNDNPDLIQLISVNPVLDPVRLGITKSPDSFKDLMKNIHKKSGSGSKIKI